MSKIRASGIDINVQRLAPAGTSGGKPAPVVVLIHGLLTDSLASYYFTLGPAFAAAGVDVIMYDLRGHGRTSRPSREYRLEHFVADLVALLDALRVTAPVHLVGNSFGGSVAFGLAAAHPDRVASLTMIEGEPPVPAWTRHMAAGLAEAKARLVRDDVIDWIADQHGSHTARLSKLAGRILKTTTMAEDIPLSRTIAEDLSEVRCPVFALFGDRSGLAEQVDHLHACLHDVRSVVLPDQGHSVLIERTEETSRLILNWIHLQSRNVKAVS